MYCSVLLRMDMLFNCMLMCALIVLVPSCVFGIEVSSYQYLRDVA